MKSPLPMREGISPSQIVLPEGGWPTVLEFLCARFPDIDETAWRSRMQRGLVVDDAGTPLTPDRPYRNGVTIHYYRELAFEPRIPFEAEILHQDEHLLIADKPHFLPVIPAGRYLAETLLVRLKKATGIEDLAPLHRLDRGTAGIVAFSVNPATRGIFQSLFPRREVLKEYEALAPTLADTRFPLLRRTRLVEGDPFFLMREAEGEPNSETRIELGESRGALSLYRLHPVTGRKHQLRVHMAALGAPIANDAFYPQLQPELEDEHSRPLQLLARALEFTDPLTGERRRYESRRQLAGRAAPTA